MDEPHHLTPLHSNLFLSCVSQHSTTYQQVNTTGRPKQLASSKGCWKVLKTNPTEVPQPRSARCGVQSDCIGYTDLGLSSALAHSSFYGRKTINPPPTTWVYDFVLGVKKYLPRSKAMMWLAMNDCNALNSTSHLGDCDPFCFHWSVSCHQFRWHPSCLLHVKLCTFPPPNIPYELFAAYLGNLQLMPQQLLLILGAPVFTTSVSLGHVPHY